MAANREEMKLTVISTLKKLRRPCTTLDLASSLGMKRSEVNPFLYELQKQGLIKKVQESSPPKWDLTNEGAMYGVRKSAQRPARGRGRGILSLVSGVSRPGLDSQPVPTTSAHSHTPVRNSINYGNRSAFQRQILQVLEKATKPHTALEIAHKVGRKTRKEVNPDLYAMQKEGVVMMEQTSPPQWILVRESAGGDAGMESVSSTLPHETEEKMEVQSYSVSQVDLSQIPEQNTGERLLAVMHASPELGRTELELRRAIGTTTSRAEVKSVLELLLSEGLVQKTFSIPTKWSISGHTPPGALGNASSTTVQSPGPSSYPSASATPASVSTPPSFSSALAIDSMNKNPVSALMEYCQANKLEQVFVDVREYGPPHLKHFVVAAKVGATQYQEVESTNKKDAKRKAADIALQAIQQAQTTQQVQASVSTSSGATAGGTFSDKIAELSIVCYREVQSSIQQPQPGRKVIAAFVMEDVTSGELRVVSVGSGTRCITGDHMSLEGLVVNDSHAEVVARRSLIRFFYKQLFAYHQGSAEQCIFEEIEDNPGLVRVKSDYKFHLYISTAPCGDGAQFSRCDDPNRDPPADNKHVPTMQGRVQGVLRTKMEGGEGTIPIASDTVPLTWDGVMQGGRLRTMSCSDKVGRWNVLGLQGSLLSLFMTPVYMSSLTLGSLHHHGHLSRAVCCRFADIRDSLPDGFVTNHPSLGRVQGGDEMQRHTEKTSNFSVNWSLGDERGELVDGGNGRPVPPSGLPKSQLPKTPARIAKIKLYAKFVKLANTCNRSELVAEKSYAETKEQAVAFQEAKQALFQHCKKKGYGAWMRKPVEEKQFGMDVLERLNEE